MKIWKKIFVAAAILTAIGAVDLSAMPTGSGVNLNLSPEQPEGYENLWNRMTRKLGRGIVNVGFGALELPIRIFEVNFNEGGLAACTFGVLSGLGYVVVREVVGVVEILTFPFPLPGCPNDPQGYGAGYGPILTPEWVVTPETNYFNIFYSRGAFVD